MIVEPATTADVPAMVALLGILFAQEGDFTPAPELQERGLRQLLGQPHLGTLLVLREGSEVVGMASLLHTISTALGGPVAWLEDVVVRPDRRGRGAGTFLLEGVIEHAKAAGFLRLTLLTDKNNTGAQRLYARAGFTTSGMIPMRLVFD